MAKFRDLEKGATARKPVTFMTLTGKEAKAEFRIMSGADYEETVAAATARMRNVAGTHDEIMLAFALDCETVARALIDPDSPPDKPEPFFENADEVRNALDRDRIFLLASEHRGFQESTSPLVREQTVEEFWKSVIEHSEAKPDAELPFEDWPRPTQRVFVRTMAAQLALLRQLRSLPTSTSSPVAAPSSNVL